MIKISLNGQTSEIEFEYLVDAMKAWQYTLDQCAVAINGEFVPRSQYPATQLNNGDEIDIVGAVGGG